MGRVIGGAGIILLVAQALNWLREGVWRSATIASLPGIDATGPFTSFTLLDKVFKFMLAHAELGIVLLLVAVVMEFVAGRFD